MVTAPRLAVGRIHPDALIACVCTPLLRARLVTQRYPDVLSFKTLGDSRTTGHGLLPILQLLGMAAQRIRIAPANRPALGSWSVCPNTAIPTKRDTRPATFRADVPRNAMSRANGAAADSARRDAHRGIKVEAPLRWTMP